MLPSSTVENYLKTIFKAQASREGHEDLVPMGQLAAALGVVPGTATTMVKALAESGLVTYEPYSGVRLTPAGEKLAALVLRRHRLIELFLVQAMGMSWAEVHDEAERLEHAVSDRLIERIDEMLGRPAVDPHGDPIPGPEGTVWHREYEDLLTCPLHTPVVVTRVADQNPAFLRFIEESELKPGQAIEVEERDEAADSVRVRGRNGRRLTLGARAASKVLVEVARALLLVAIGAGVALAQAQGPSPTVQEGSSRPFAILDNSFLVEEAFNQEPGIFQNILNLRRAEGGDWELAFTQEWPLGSQTHQLSFTVSMVTTSVPAFRGRQTGVGDVLINYRYQALQEGEGRPAFSPRLSIIVPTGSEERGHGDGMVGVEVNLPFSKQTGEVYWHWNAGFKLLPHVYAGENVTSRTATYEALVSPRLAGSAIWRVRPMLNLMLEGVTEFEDSVSAFDFTTPDDYVTTVQLSPGVRGGWNLGERQIVVGVAVPVTVTAADTDAAIFGYFSYELPFRK